MLNVTSMDTSTSISMALFDERPTGPARHISATCRVSNAFRLIRLHLRYLRFDTVLLATLPHGRHRPLGHLVGQGLAYAAV